MNKFEQLCQDFDLDIIDYKDRKNIICKDSGGYYYKINRSNLLQRKQPPDRFGKNPYMINNISTWLKEVNSPLCLLSNEYRGAHTNLQFRCTCHPEKVQEHTFSVVYNNGGKCVFSSRQNRVRRVSQEEIETTCREKHLSYQKHYSGSYNSKQGTIVEFVCDIHTDKGLQVKSWADLRRFKQPCAICSGRGKTTEDFRKEIYDFNPNVELLGTFQGVEHPIECKCLVCGHQWSPQARSLKTTGCPECGKVERGLSRRKGQTAFEKELYEVQPHLIIEGEFTTMHQMTKFKCNIHQYTFESIPSNILNQSAHCPKCTQDKQKMRISNTHDYYIGKIKGIRSDVEVLSTYNGYWQSMQCRCKTHDVVYEAKYSSLIDGHLSCPLCKIEHRGSVGENKICSYLIDHNIIFDPEHKFEDCKNVGLLRFDFYLPDYNICIEYDGEQHYYPVTFNSISFDQAQYNYNQTIIRDRIKDKYCLQHDIYLIRIPYWDLYRIDEILSAEFSTILQKTS